MFYETGKDVADLVTRRSRRATWPRTTRGVSVFGGYAVHERIGGDGG